MRTLALVSLLTFVAASAEGTLLLDDIERERRGVERALRDGVSAALDGDGDGLGLAFAQLRSRNRTNLGPPLRLLVTARTPSGAARDHAARDLLRDWDSPIAERHRAHLDSIDAADVATRLTRDERHDRWAAAVNDAVRPFGLGTNLLAVVNPVLLAGSALTSVINTTTHIRFAKRASMRERAALAGYRDAVARSPSGRLEPRQAVAAERLASRVRAENCRTLKTDIADATEANRRAHAHYLLRSPAAGPCAAEIERLRQQVDDAQRVETRQRRNADWPAAHIHLPRDTSEWLAYAAVSQATLVRDAAAMEQAARRLITGRAKSPFEGGAELVRATAQALAGNDDEAREALERLASRSGTAAATARTLLATRPEHAEAAVDQAERTHRRAVARYVLVGPAVGARNLLQGAVQTTASGLAGLQFLGIGNAIGMLTRGFRAWRRDPASNQDVIAKGETYLARNPDGADVSRVRERLVRAYERSGRYERALLHYLALPSPDTDRVRDLENSVARGMLESARSSNGDLTLLRAIVTHYPASPAAEQAREVLSALDTADGVRVSRAQLESVPALLGASGLGLPAGLLDGERENGELHDDGIRVTPHAMEIAVIDPDDERATETLALDATASARVRATLAEVVLAARRRGDDGADRGRWERYVPISLEGSLGDAGVSVRPTIKLRPYRPAHPALYR